MKIKVKAISIRRCSRRPLILSQIQTPAKAQEVQQGGLQLGREKQPAEGIGQGAAPQLAPSLVQPSHQANHVLPDPLAPMQSHSDGSEALSNHSKDLGA